MKLLSTLGLLATLAFAACSAGPQVLTFDSGDTAMPKPATKPAATKPGPPPFVPGTTITPEGCSVERFTIPSACMKRDIKVAIVLPPAYQTDKDARFPVLYTLHGADAPFATFAEMAPLRQTLRVHPMILTCFDGDARGWYIDSLTHPESQFFTFFFKEFIPYVDAHYRTRADGNSRGLTGFSMGGYGAFNYMLAHPEMFASASSMSGVFDYFGDRTGQPNRGLRRLMGPPENLAAYLQYGIYNRMLEHISKGDHLPEMLLTCGTDDGLIGQSRTMLSFLLDQNTRLHQEKKEVLVFEYKELSGGHNWPFWLGESTAISDFHWRSFQKAQAKAAAK